MRYAPIAVVRRHAVPEYAFSFAPACDLEGRRRLEHRFGRSTIAVMGQRLPEQVGEVDARPAICVVCANHDTFW